MFLLLLRQLPRCGDRTPASVLPPTEGRPSPTNSPVFPPSSFILPSFGWFCIFFSSGQVFLSAFSWCAACTSVSEGVFLMYLWREPPPAPLPSCFPPFISSVQFRYSVVSRLCDPMNCSTPGLPVHHQLPELIQIHVHQISDAIQPSHPPAIPFSCLQIFPASGSFQMSQFFASGGQSIGVPASTSVLPMNSQD